MANRVGIPRALFYYQFYPMWKTFFEELGVELVVSDRTSKIILDEGVKSCVDEACLPVKIFHGHVLNLKDRVDYIFIPRYTSISKNEYVCPKFGGLPDMIRNTIPGLPGIIDTEINLRKKKSEGLKAAYEIGSLFCNNRKLIAKAYKKSLESYKDFRNQVKKGALPGDIIEKKLTALKKPDKFTLNIAVIGHGYNIYDSYINMNLLQKLKKQNVNITTIDMISERIINQKAETLQKKMFWNFGRKAMGGVLDILDRNYMDGIIYLMSFGCGVDSFVCDLVERKIRQRSDLPFTVIMLDEHSGEAGLNTRIEAFIDMIRRRERNENNISAHG